jgi:hypothetical protein
METKHLLSGTSILLLVLLAAPGAGARPIKPEHKAPSPVQQKSVKIGFTPINQKKSNTDSSTYQITSVNHLIAQGLDYEDDLEEAQGQVTSVSQLSDIQPTDWSFQALQSLVERYGCIAGYPDGSFRGNRAMTRYEFAAGLNACLDRLTELIASSTGNLASRDDLEALQRMQEEFAPELAVLRGRVDVLEARTAELESNQFTNSITILGGQVIMGLSNAWGGGPPGDGEASPVFTHLTQLQTASTFTGKDRLRMELLASNFGGRGFAEENALNTFTSLLSYQADTQNDIILSLLEYRFAALGDRVVFTLRPVGFSLSSVLTVNSPFFDNGRGAISRFGEGNPVFKIGGLEGGVGLDWLISRRIRFQLAYGARGSSNPEDGFALGTDTWMTGAQFLFLLGSNAQMGLSAIYGRSPDGRLYTFTGSGAADNSGYILQPSIIGALSLTLQWRVSPKFTIAGWGGGVVTYASKTDNGAVSTNWAISLAFPDILGREGDLFGIVVGSPPKIIEIADFDASTGITDEATSYHFEFFYRVKVNDNISITPGVFFVTKPGNIDANNTIYIGTIRTTFRF